MTSELPMWFNILFGTLGVVMGYILIGWTVRK